MSVQSQLVEKLDTIDVSVSGTPKYLLDIVGSSDMQLEIFHLHWLSETQNDCPVQGTVARIIPGLW